MSDNLNKTLGTNLSKDLETEGFDLQAGESWIYPTNYPVREYQYNITQAALLKNTLVSLPTGLGKTFIAAVVMYNYFRWYPLGKVVFMAPTRPLVKQQIDACYDIMAIPKDCTVEITGAKMSNSREEMWNKKRVFFITPQILQNDLEKFQDLGSKIKCVVFDEAHRARGNHAYCEVIRKLTTSNKYFRVLALSATPGGSINDVLEVVHNLLISHLEFRIEESLDVSPYVFQRNVTTVVVPLGDKLQSVRDAYMKVLEYYTRTLMKYKVIQGNCANLTKGKIFMLMKNYQHSNRGTSPNYAEIMKSLNICITLYHAAELLVRHGLRNFLTFYEEHIDKPLLRNNTDIREIMADVREYLGPPLQIQRLPDGEYSGVSENVKFGHPKFYQLRDILLQHFKESDGSSRVIVFFEYRESVMEAYALLIRSKPTLKPRIFIGQKQGVTQKLQINVVKAFRAGLCNVLLSTCIGEEGLDVGEVDLIVCFDISNKSPIRMVQRMGRTGRKKNGNIIVLVTEGKEQQTLKDCLIHKNNVAFHVLGSKELAKGLKSDCSRLIPARITPKCEKIFITVEKPVIKNDSNLKGMLRTLSSRSSDPSFSQDLQIIEIEEKIPQSELLALKDNPFDENVPLSNTFSKKIEKQRSFQEFHQIDHSSNCELLVNLLRMAESRRFNIPMSQINAETHNKNLKQTDIRNMFLKSQSANDFILPTTPVTPETTSQNNTEDKYFGDPELFTELTNFLSIQMDNPERCRLCPDQLNCDKTQYKKYSAKTVLTWIQLDAIVYLDITEEDLKFFEKGCDTSQNGSFQFDESMNFQIPDTPINKTVTQKETKVLELTDLIDTSILSDFCNTTISFQAPKTLNNLLKRYNTSLINEEDILQKTQIKNQSQNKTNNFETLQKRIEKQQENQKVYTVEEINKILEFFKLESLDSLLEGIIPDSQITISYSPDMFDEIDVIKEKSPIMDDDDIIINSNSSSPILCSYINKMKRSELQSSLLAQNSIQPTHNALNTVTDTLANVSQDSKHSLESSRKLHPLSFEDLFDFSSFELPSNNMDQTILVSDKIISLTDSCTTNDLCEEPLTKSLRNSDSDEKSRTSRKSSGLEMFCDEELLKSPKVSDSKSLNQDIKYFTAAESTHYKQENDESLSNIIHDSDFPILNMDSNITQSHIKLTDCKRAVNQQRSRKPVITNIKNNDNIIKLSDLEKCKKSLEFSNSTRPKSQRINNPSRICEENDVDERKSLDFFDFEPTTKKPKSQRIDNLRSICQKNDVDERKSLDLFVSTTNQNLERIFVNKTQASKLSNLKPQPNPHPDKQTSNCTSQASITQIISLVNKPTQGNKTSQKENLNQNIPEVEDFFDFSFNTKKQTKPNNSSPSKVAKLRESPDKSANTTLGSKSHNSSARSETSLNTSLKGSGNKSVNEVRHNLTLNNSFKKYLNSNTSNSDDEFETKPKSPVWIRTKPLIRKTHVDNSDDEFENKATSPVFAKPIMMKKNRIENRRNHGHASGSSRSRIKRKTVDQFIEDEAELSLCDKSDVSDDENDCITQDHYDESFVADETQNVDSQMHAIYLRSIRSPRLSNRFKFPTRFKNNINIYSQPQPEPQDESDLDDSFVVNDEDIESQEELSQLEILENQLEIQRKRKKILHKIKQPTKRRRIIIDSDSD